MRNYRQYERGLCRVSLSGTASGSALTLSPTPDFNSFIRQIIVTPATSSGVDATTFDFYVKDESNVEVFRFNSIRAWFNTIVRSDGEQQPPFMLPAYGKLTFNIENSSRDEAYAITFFYN